MSLAEHFHTWALSADRTNDELYTIELLVAEAWRLWCRQHDNHAPFDLDASLAESKQRRLNPAYRAQIPRDRLDVLVEVWADMRQLWQMRSYDRPMGEVDTLRFFPQLTDVEIRGNFTRIDVLAELRGLKRLVINSETVVDIRALAGLPELEHLRLTLQTPWPDLSALATLPALRKVHYQGNLLALNGVPALSAVVEAEFNADHNWKTPLRDLRELPAMPAVRRLRVSSVATLEGVERFPALNLQLQGTFSDLSPLGAHPSVTWLHLHGQQFQDLSPVARIPALRELCLEREHPLDLSPLVEAPHLRQVWVTGCDILATELAAINALLTPWSDDFMLPEPRPLAPLQFVAIDRSASDFKAVRALPRPPDPRDAFFGEDVAYNTAEACWFGAELNRRLDALLGRGWRGKEDYATYGAPGRSYHWRILEFTRYEDMLKLREIVTTIRELMAATRLPREVCLKIEPHGNLDDDIEEITGRDDDAAAEVDRKNWLEYHRHQREHREFLERQYRLRLQQEQGLSINPQDFSPPPDKDDPEPEEPEAGDLQSEDPEDEDADELEDEDAEGGTAFDTGEDQGAESLGERLSIVLHLNEHLMSTNLDKASLAADYYGEAPVNWHDLPESPEQRPRTIW